MVIPINFKVLYNRIRAKLYQYDFLVIEHPLPPPNTGSFDGLTITVDPIVSTEVSCFILLHLFGHSVQWTAPSLKHLLAGIQSAPHAAVFLKELRTYEFDGAGYGLTILHDIVGHRLDQWYSNLVLSDWNYVEEFYRTGKIPVGYDIVSNATLIHPSPIPPLIHEKVEVRYAF